MAWYFRKAVEIGPVRFNLSKSGIGASFGVKGFRIGIRPDGRSYIHAGRNGIYYHEELTDKTKSQNTINKDDSSINNTIFYNTAGTDELKSNYKTELVEALTKSYTAFRYDYLTGAIGLIITFMFLLFTFLAQDKDIQSSQIQLAVIIAINICLFLIVAKWETKRRSIDIIYEFENNDYKYYENIILAFNKIAECNKIWSLISSLQLSDTYQYKINAGASSLVNTGVASGGTGKLPWVNTNISIPLIKANNKSIYFVPDGIIVYDTKGIAYVEYQSLKINNNTINFIDEFPPSDANIIDKTWQYTNINGTPDRRFKYNKQIPVCRYGELKIETSDKLLLYIMTSIEDAPKEFKEAMNKLQTTMTNKRNKQHKK